VTSRIKSTALTSADLAAQRDQAEAAVSGWVAKIASAENALSAFLEQSGGLVVDDPDSAERIAAEGALKRTLVELAARALPEAVRRHQAAARAVFEAQAEEVTPRIDEARERLAEHVAERDKLLRALADFSGIGWREDKPTQAEIRARLDNGEQRITVRNSAADQLGQEVRALEQEEQSLRSAANTVEPLAIVDPEWAAASRRLLAAGGQLSETSADHLNRWEAAEQDRRTAEADRAATAGWEAAVEAQDRQAAMERWLEAVRLFAGSFRMSVDALDPEAVARLFDRDFLDSHQMALRGQALEAGRRAGVDLSAVVGGEAA
jgi:hypothetical protein